MDSSTEFIFLLLAAFTLPIIGCRLSPPSNNMRKSDEAFQNQSLRKQSAWTTHELTYSKRIVDWGWIISHHDKLFAVSLTRIAYYDGSSLKNILEHADTNIVAADFSDKYFAYSVHPIWVNYQLKEQLFISAINEKGNEIKLVYPHRFSIPFSQYIAGIKFLNENQILITSYLEYGIVSINRKPGGDFDITFSHYPFLPYATGERLEVDETFTHSNILIYAGLGVNLLQELPNNKYSVRGLFSLRKNFVSGVTDETWIKKIAMVDTSFGAVLVHDNLVYYKRNLKSGNPEFIVTNYIHTDGSDSIDAKHLVDIKLLSNHELLCLTDNGLVLKQEINRNNVLANTWEIIKKVPVKSPNSLAVVNEDTIVVVGAYRLFMINKSIQTGAANSNSATNSNPSFEIAHLVQPSTSYGVGLGDLDNNGTNDIYLVDVYDRNRLFVSIPEQVMNNIPDNLAAERGVAGRISKAKSGHRTFDLDIGVAIGDINEDGAEDMILTNLAHSNSLYLNNGKGYFQDVTDEYNFNVNMWRSEGAVFGDVNNDGYLDVFSTSFFKSNKLFINSHGISLNDETNKYGLKSNGRSISAVFGDVNNDGYLDLYVGNWMKGNKLFINDGHGGFVDRTKESGVGCGDLKETNSVLFADFNNDGYLDLFVGNRAGGNKLFLNNGDGTFRDVTKECGLDGDYHTYGAVFGDFDNDGWQDIVIACLGGIKYFKNLGVDSSGQIHFKDITSEWISTDVFKGYGTGLATADFGNKGLLDLVMNQNGGYTYFLLNRTHLDGTNNYLSVKVEGDESDRDAVGAKLKLFYKDSLIGYREVSGGFGYASSSSKIQHFGLGSLKGPFSLVVYFPTSHITRRFSPVANSFITVSEHTGTKRSYFLARKYMLRFIYGKGFIILGIEFILLLALLLGFISLAATKLKLYKRYGRRVYFSWSLLAAAIAVFYMIKAISVESMTFYFGPAYFIINSTNFFTDEILPLLSSCLFVITFLFVKRNRETKTLSEYNILDNLLTALKRFGHGEGMLMVLHRLSLLAENTNLSEGASADYNKEAFERIGSAYSEYKSAVHPEILRIYGLLDQLDKKDPDNAYKANYSRLADSLVDSDEQVQKNCELLLTDSLLKDKVKARQEIIFSIRNLKGGLSKLRSTMQSNFSVDISDAIELAIRKFREQKPDLTIQFMPADGRINAIISSADLNEVLNIMIQNAIDEMNEKGISPGLIRITADSLDERVVIKIEDNGRGISSDIREKIFDEGFTTKPSGHGLGLSIVRKCLEKYEGQISVNTGELGGALFVLQLKSI
ncbi:MAG: FG-GAP-like repeat-containing protein [Bacteroidetes bacterium]|nr:FG-GAP-like repeat-containing protein [Bacteroidota bacterium]MCL5738695.1 FG-GAP-like repeat-containing protein [Bacteroidota bacterium]